MDARVFGPLERSVPLIGQGTWNLEETDRARAVAALRRGLDLGMTHIDTAEMYGWARRGDRRRGDRGPARRGVPGRRRSSRATRRARGDRARASGACSGCGPIASICYLLHWRGSHPLEETIAAFEALRARREDPRLGRQQLRRRRSRARRWRSPARGGSPATRCSITWTNAPSSTRSSRGARSTASRSSATAPSARARSLRAERRAGACSPRSRGARRDAAPGRAPVSGARPTAVRHPEERRPPRTSTENAGAGRVKLTASDIDADRRGVSAQGASGRAADNLI